MYHKLLHVAAAAAIIAGVASAPAAFAQSNTAPASSTNTQGSMQGQGMMGKHSGMNGMMGNMQAMSRMANTCNTMMQRAMNQPAGKHQSGPSRG
ncbi:hypothetical protein [Lichenicoccus sp.]|uniref:hypothetical protein n=1 Tax=Lichenicoccus sp. TaxID=2781899 RepID=UPI003D0CBD46